MKYVYNFKMKGSDYRDYIYCRTFGAQAWRRYFILITWIVSAICLFLDYANVITLNQTLHMCVLMVTVIVAMAAITAEINIHKYNDAYKNGFKAERQIIASDEGLVFRNRASDESGANKWEDISRIDEMKMVFVIQLEAREAVILPKRAMGTQVRVDEFIALVNRHIPEHFFQFAPLHRSIHQFRNGILPAGDLRRIHKRLL